MSERIKYMNNNQNIEVGIGVLIIKNNKVLFGKRKNSHGKGTWCFPGGHLKFDETWEECAKRETLEETGLEIKNIRFATATNNIFIEECKHSITIIMIADYESGELILMEPDKCEIWEWFNYHTPPQPLFRSQLILYEQGYDPFKK